MKTIKHFIKKTTFMTGLDHGWGNGYIILPKGHKYNGTPYDDIPVDVHFGLTFGEPVENLTEWEDVDQVEDEGGYVIGFDTCHYRDNMYDWPQDAVEAETIRLKEQLIEG